MVIAITQNVVNIVASLGLVFGLGMKVEGVALGTLVAQYAGFLMAVVMWVVTYGRLWKHFQSEALFAWRSMKGFLGVNRDITYYIGRKALADKYGITVAKAGHIIGLLDLVIHETDDGRIEIVPNNVHRFKQLYAHKGYVSKMLKLINGKEVADEDE